MIRMKKDRIFSYIIVYWKKKTSLSGIFHLNPYKPAFATVTGWGGGVESKNQYIL